MEWKLQKPARVKNESHSLTLTLTASDSEFPGSSSRKYQRRVRDPSKKLGIYANPYNTDRLSSVR